MKLLVRETQKQT